MPEESEVESRVLTVPSRVFASLANAFAAALLLCVVEPLRAAFGNWDELSIGLSELALRLFEPFALSAGVLFAAALLTTLIFTRRGVAFQSALLVGFFVQSQFFVWDLGLLDGSDLDWSRHAGKGWLEVAFWSLLLGFAYWRWDALARRAGFVAALVAALAVVSLAGSYYRGAPFAERRLRTIEEEAGAFRLRERILSYSSERNVLVIVLDALQSDFFSELLSDREFAEAVPPGFTYYRNAVSPYPGTQLSLPSILTSQTLGESTDMVRWQVEQMAQSVPARLARQGFDASLVSWAPYHLSCGEQVFGYSCLSLAALLPLLDDAIRKDLREVDALADRRRLLGIASFRLTPYLLKPWIYHGGRFRLPIPIPIPDGDRSGGLMGDARVWPDSRRDVAVLEALARDADRATRRPTFKLLHFFGAHLPSTLTGDCEWNGRESPETSSMPELIDGLIAAGDPVFGKREEALGSSRCVLRLTFRLLDRLDELGVYDDTLVFVLADHARPAAPVDLTTAEPPIAGAESGAAGARAKRGVPLFLVKRLAARHPLRVSDAAVSLCDVPRSIFRELRLRQSFDCESVFEIERTGRRTPRNHYLLPRVPLRDLKPGVRFERFDVAGHSWLDESWVEIPPGRARALAPSATGAAR